MKPVHDTANASRQAEGASASRSKASGRDQVMVGAALLTGASFVGFTAYGMITGDHALLSRIWSTDQIASYLVLAWAAKDRLLPVLRRVGLEDRGAAAEPPR
jgi:hypothetical protein